ncbi:hypothetical protein [Lysinibacillus cavernae]|uniref:hypothetical protein n=1 Tax=Lysinibacillus cavernae TaxID=2666135 RepID=UPI0012D8F858|nr:hypothetical protein [Lysinibacillus cavernae]
MSHHANEQTINQAKMEFLKALHYLDYGKVAQGGKCLKLAIQLANMADDQTTFIRAAICYGDLLWHIEKYDASKHWLQLAINRFSKVQADSKHSVEVDVQKARSLLKQIQHSL